MIRKAGLTAFIIALLISLPVVAPFPAPSWDVKGEAEAYILEILRQAIGYRVRLR